MENKGAVMLKDETQTEKKFTLQYCKKCVMPNTRPGLKFNEEGICQSCINFENRKNVDWDKRWKELEALADKYRGCNGDYYDCIITASGGKDSHYQAHIFKEKLKMNPLLVMVDNVSWTETGRKNWNNIRTRYSLDAHVFSLNPNVCKKMFKKALIKLGAPTWYFDRAIYAYPLHIAVKLGIPLIVYGENTNYERGGPLGKTETYSALGQINNDVVKPVPLDEWLDENLTIKDLQPAIYPTKEEIEKAKLDPVYLSYFVPWSSHGNYEYAKKNGFLDLDDTLEWDRKGLITKYDQIDTIGYLTHTWLKFLKFGHWMTTDYCSLYVREGIMTREEALKVVNEIEYILDSKMLKDFIDFIEIDESEFWQIVEKYANLDIVEKRDGLWRLKEPAG